MYEYQQLKISYESSLHKIKEVQGRVFHATFILLVGSIVVSQFLFSSFKDPSLYRSSSLWMLIAGLPFFGFLLKKGKALDHQIYETILQGLDLEGPHNPERFFAEQANYFRRNRQFIIRSLPMWCLNILIIAWSRFMLKTSGTEGVEYFRIMTLVGCSFGSLALYVYFFSSAPYRKFLNAVKKYAFLD